MSALALRIIACLSMLLDHIGFQYGLTPLRCIGRIAFPLFLYLIVNGYRHTSSKFLYGLRLAVFAALSQIPFSLFIRGTTDYQKGNVFFTLLICLLCICLSDWMDRNRLLRRLSLLPMVLAAGLYLSGTISSDYGVKAVFLVTVFYLFDRNNGLDRVLTVLGLLVSLYYSFLLSCGKQLLILVQGGTAVLPKLGQWELLQLFSLLSLVFIFLYNGRPGPRPQNKLSRKLVQYGFYAFYPLHMLALWALR